MKRNMFGLAAVCVLAALLLAACGGGGTTSVVQTAPTATPTTAAAPTATATTATSSGAATIKMGSVSFVGGTSVTIKAGQAVTFDDPSSGGGFHNLVIGTHGTFSSQSGAPSQLNNSNGMSFSPGDNVDITFSTAGTFNITCTIHPTMQVTVTVQ